ncbi:MAG: GAD-like domain-containing protein [Pyrinomonadaceae bacterium]
MSQFTEFKKKFGAGRKCRPATAESLREYQDRLPAALLEEWQETGWCSYDDGLLWLVNPAELADVLADWLDPAAGHLVIGRTSFGDLLLWNQQGLHYLHVVFEGIAFQTDRIDIYFNSLITRDEYLDEVLDRPLHRRAVKKLGELEYDECYGFEPAVALGGPGTLDTLRVVKLREYLGLLAQFSTGLKNV